MHDDDELALCGCVLRQRLPAEPKPKPVEVDPNQLTLDLRMPSECVVLGTMNAPAGAAHRKD